MTPTFASTPVTFRIATAADAARVAEMAVRFIATTRYGALVTPSLSALNRLIALVLDEGVILLAETDRRPLECAWPSFAVSGLCVHCGFDVSLHGPYVVGMLAIVPRAFELNGARYGDEMVWWVEPEYRTSSIGPRLLRAAELWARRAELVALKMVAPADSDVGRFYERLGYTVVETAYLKPLEALHGAV